MCQQRWNEEWPSPYVLRFFDENGIRRKQYIIDHKRLERADVFDERGDLTGYMITDLSYRRPMFHIQIVTQIKQVQTRIQTRIAYYDLSIEDLTLHPRAD